MMVIMDKITGKPDWDEKVFDDIIVQKWRQGALAIEGMDVSEKMLDWLGTASFRKHGRDFVAPSSLKDQGDYAYAHLQCTVLPF